MNVSDVKDIPIPEGVDLLSLIFKAQAVTGDRYRETERKNGTYYPDKVNMDNPQDQAFIKDLCMRTITELIEAMECLKNKPWKNSHVVTDMEHYYEEIADALSFFIEMCIKSGLTAETLYQYHAKKTQVNDFRVKTNY